jgi:hypothetical protein
MLWCRSDGSLCIEFILRDTVVYPIDYGLCLYAYETSNIEERRGYDMLGEEPSMSKHKDINKQLSAIILRNRDDAHWVKFQEDNSVVGK